MGRLLSTRAWTAPEMKVLYSNHREEWQSASQGEYNSAQDVDRILLIVPEGDQVKGSNLFKAPSPSKITSSASTLTDKHWSRATLLGRYFCCYWIWVDVALRSWFCDRRRWCGNLQASVKSSSPEPSETLKSVGLRWSLPRRRLCISVTIEVTTRGSPNHNHRQTVLT